MDFSQLPPSTQWAALMFRGERFAEVWFKPEGQPFALTFRIPQKSFQILGMGQRLTMENLLKAVGIAPEEVESWHDESGQHSSTNEPSSEFRRPLSPLAQDVAHLILHVSLKPPQTVDYHEATELSQHDPSPPESSGEAHHENSGSEINPGGGARGEPVGGFHPINEETWQFLEERWKLILGLEASLDHLRMNMEGLRSEMEASTRKTLPLDVKANAVSVDVVQWDKAKNRIRYAVPKMNEFIHRAVWATGVPERKKLAELFENHVQHRIPFPNVDEVMIQVDGLLKDRQTLFAQGSSVHQECKRISTDCQVALRTLESNANSRRKKR